MSPEAIRRRAREKLLEQRELVEELLHEREQLQGSLFARYGVCGKESCACREGRKHGPYYVLSTRSGGKGGFAYLEGHHAEEARELVKRHRAFKAGMRRLKRIGEQLVVLLRRYQEAMARQGGRRVGLPAQAAS
jgi:Family of unknown function (DUF6788)